MARVAVVSTHLDDAVFSCYSALSPETCVVTVLAGLPPAGVLGAWDRDGGATDSRSRVLERREEDRQALLRSRSRATHLDFYDAQYVGLGGIAAPTPSELCTGLAAHLEAAETVFAPAGIRNPEHKLVRDAVLTARSDSSLYADLPYALHPEMGGFRLPAELDPEDWVLREEALPAAAAADKVDSSRCSTALSWRSCSGSLARF
jgi:hypothetical protein